MLNSKFKMIILVFSVMLIMGIIACAGPIDDHNNAFRVVIEELQNRITVLENIGCRGTHLVYPQKWATGEGTKANPWANDCINTAYSNCSIGGTIFLKAGYYTLGTLLNIEGKRCNIIGEGIGNTFIITSIQNTHAIRVVDDYCMLKDFTLDADSQLLNQNLQGISLKDGNYLTIENIEVKNAGYAGIEYADINYSILKHLYLHDNNWMGCHSAHLTSSGGKHNIFQDIYTWNHTHQGFDDGNVNWIANCDNVYNNIHSWNNGQEGIVFWDIIGGRMSNCSAWDCDEYGLNIGYAKDFEIHDCNFSLNNESGIRITDSDGITFTNVISKNNNVGDVAYIPALIITGNSTNVRLINCRLHDDRAVPQQDWGIYTDTNNPIEVINCKLLPQATAATYGPINMSGDDFTQIKANFDALLVRIQIASEAINE